MAGAVGLAVLKAMEKDKTMENSRIVGTYLLEKLIKLVDRGRINLFIKGIESLEQNQTFKPQYL